MLDLFSGVGGFSLGLERSGLARTVAFCEIDPFCRKVLKKHWPEIPQYDDIRELTAARLAADGIERPRAICGGFPCQDISVAGRGAGLAGERSGLWREYARLIGELRPDLVFVENVAALLGRGLGTVLGDLAAFGYDAEWEIISASSVGAFHCRQRLWIVAYPNNDGVRPQRFRAVKAGTWGEQQFSRLVQDTLQSCIPTGRMGGISDGVPNRTHRLKSLGNAVVPQIPELLGRAVMKAMQ